MSEKVLYQCVQCGRIFDRDRLSKVAETRCPYCGFNVLKKARPGSAKLVKTSKLSEEQKLFF